MTRPKHTSARAAGHTVVSPHACGEPHACGADLRYRVMRHSPLTCDLTDEQRMEFDNHVSALAWAKGEALFTQGAELDGSYMIMAGTVRMVQSTDTGAEVTIDIAGEGDVIGSLVPGRTIATESAWATTTVCALFLPADRLVTVASQHPLVATAIIELQQRRLQESQSRKVSAATTRVTTRVAHALDYLSGKFGRTLSDGSTLIDAPVRREDIAGLAGTTLESTSREMSRLTKDGVIDSTRESIRILAPRPGDSG